MKSLIFPMFFLVAAVAVSAGEARVVSCPEGPLSAPVRAAKIPETAEAFTVSFRFRASEYVKRPGPWEGLVFANGNGWSDGFRATVTPASSASFDGFKMSLRAVKASGKAATLPLKTALASGRWYRLAFVCGGGELKGYVNGTLVSSCRFEGRFKRPSCGFSVGPAGFGVGYYPFAVRDFTIRERAADAGEILALVTGGETSAGGTAEFLKRLPEADFADMRPLAWNTARRLVDAGDRRSAAELYLLLAERRAQNPATDGGNETAALFAGIFGGEKAECAVKYPERVPFAGYGTFRMEKFRPDTSKAVFVAVDGSDSSGDGSAQRPFGSVGHALEAVRGRSEKTVLLKGGRYMLDRGITLVAADSGSAASPLVIASAPGERAILDGGKDVEGFAPCGRGEILCADLRGRGFTALESPRCWGYALSGKGEKHILDLYEDGRPGELARHPNSGFFKTVWADRTNAVFRTDLSDAAEWAHEPELMALTYMRWLWGDETTKIKIAADGTMQLDTNVVRAAKTGRPVKLMNSLKALDEPGEWFLDRAACRLYHWPKRRGARVTLSQLAEPIISVKGAKHVVIRSLAMQHGMSAGIRLENCESVKILGNGLRNLGSGISARGRDIVIAGNKMRSFARGGISACGGDRRTLAPSGIRILKNDISDIERKVRTYCPCVQAEGVGIEIAFNHFHDCPSSAVRLEGNDMLVNSNLVENCVLESDDQGAVDIYANPTYAGIEIIGNVWRNIGRGGAFVPCGQAAVRFDDVISGVKVRLNKFYNCGYAHFGAVQINGGRLNVIDNNLFVNCRRDCSINVRSEAWWRHTMSEGYCKPKIAAVRPCEPPWNERYGYLTRLLEWPCMNFVSRNIYVNTPLTCRAEGENGNISMAAEPERLPEGYDSF
ncbi:MAG: right-handed parallel beta-helix repeat-containing protein [Kiritimatiellae bacterium]|nr:right-handed parallel beta-helix repeat-containing protein [Kiritimatiellia bacterium]